MLPIKTRSYLPTDRNYITNSYMRRLERQLKDLPENERYKLTKAHDTLIEHLPEAVIVCLEDDANHIVAYKVGLFSHIKKSYIKWRTEIEGMLNHE